MIEIGKRQDLKILRETSVGLFLGDGAEEDVLLPNKYCPENFEIGDSLNVFVYRDFEERKVATNLIPKINLHEFAFLKASAVEPVGAFLDWGLEKELFVPFKKQREKMDVGRSYMVYLDLDTKTDRLFATSKVEKYLQNEELSVAEGDEVDLVIYRKTDLGYVVIVNHKHNGLVFQNEVFKKINIGDTVKGYIKKIGAENQLDISLAPIGYQNYNDPNCETIHKALTKNNGFLKMTDKSSPEEIYDMFGMSKKAFKKAIGALYKDRRISIGEEGISLL